MTDEQKAAFQAAVNLLGVPCTVTFTPASPAPVSVDFSPEGAAQ